MSRWGYYVTFWQKLLNIMRIVTIGGGGGHAQVLKGLKHLGGIEITAICPSTDSGGSTGILSRDYGSLGYIGDLTKCVAALCPNRDLAKALLHRFEGGCFDNHSVKNILLLGLEQANGLSRALDLMYEVCQIKPNRVIPVATEPTKLIARLRFGGDLESETQIDSIAQNPLWDPRYHAIKEVRINPNVAASLKTLDAVRGADWLVICPGDLYSSILPVLLPRGIKETLRYMKTKVVIVLNIMTKQGETDKYKLRHFVAQIERYMGISAKAILCNNAKVNGELLTNYALEHKIWLIVPETNDPRIRLAPLATVTDEKQIYHDPQKVAEELEKIFRAN